LCWKGDKQDKEHVPRHIELTAVLRRDLKTKRIKVIEIERFEKPLDLQSNINRDQG
jgi:hypothetical protein